MRERHLTGLAQLEQGEEGNRLLDAREAFHLGVEVEPASTPQQRTEALEKLADGREAKCHVQERD
ncbi:MAG: hypothetical protein LC779_07900, partial [Actinobacteria bacterium]|nr:hypothetical protein [Actinomycetota bacterium]